MLSKILITWLLLLSSVAPSMAIVKCNGSELSVRSNVDVGLLTEKECTHVIGNIVIKNLRHGKRMPCYWSIRELHGSLIIRNTSNVGDSINFQNLRTILAGDKPAMIIEGNRGLKLGIGARLGHVYTRSKITYQFKRNWPAMMTESQHYTLYNAAANERPVFFTDNFFHTMPCSEDAYKLVAAAFGFLSLITSIGLIVCAFYGRPIKRKLE